ncbi:MAG: cation:proton antiporter, partial [bacterium]
MIESPLLQDLGVMVAGAAVLSALTRRIGVPGVVAYMVAGLVLGPMTGLVQVSAEVAMLAELGVAFLLFLVGLELSVDRVREVGGVALAAGTLQVLLTFSGGFGLALLLGFSLVASVVIGLAVTFSSTAVVVKLLAERRELATRSG